MAALRTRLTPEDAALLERLADVQRRTAALVIQGARAMSLEAFREASKKLDDERERLEAEVSQRGAGEPGESRPITVEDARAWYRSWYAPNNATLVVVGDVTPDEVKTLAQRYFGPGAKRDVPPAKKPLELAEPGERQITLRVQTQLPSLMLGFNVPSIFWSIFTKP